MARWVGIGTQQSRVRYDLMTTSLSLGHSNALMQMLHAISAALVIVTLKCCEWSVSCRCVVGVLISCTSTLQYLRVKYFWFRARGSVLAAWQSFWTTVMLHRFLVFQLNHVANFTNKLTFNFVHVENYRHFISILCVNFFPVPITVSKWWANCLFENNRLCQRL